MSNGVLRTSLCFALILSMIQSRPFYPKKGLNQPLYRAFWSFF
jgi:hypothetical protein